MNCSTLEVYFVGTENEDEEDSLYSQPDFNEERKAWDILV